MTGERNPRRAAVTGITGIAERNLRQGSELKTNGRNEGSEAADTEGCVARCCKTETQAHMSTWAVHLIRQAYSLLPSLWLCSHAEKYTCALNPAACVLFFFLCFCASASPPRIILESVATALDIKSLCCDTSIVPLLLLGCIDQGPRHMSATLPDAAGLSKIMKL